MTTVFGDQVQQYGGVPVGGDLLGFMPRGKVYWVDPDNDTGLSSDGNPGTDPTEPLRTTARAVALATAGRGDVIVLMGSEDVATQIDFSKSGLTVVGMTYGAHPVNVGEANAALYAASTLTTASPVKVTAPTRFIGIEFWGRYTSGGSVVIAGEGGGFTGGWVSFENCRFPGWGTAKYGIEGQAGAYILVKNCHFDGATSLTAGIFLDSTASNNPTHWDIIGNRFDDCTSGIEVDTACTPHNILIKSNVFIDYTDAIKFVNQAGDGLVADNWFETATDAATYDITVATAQGNGWNFSGNHYSE